MTDDNQPQAPRVTGRQLAGAERLTRKHFERRLFPTGEDVVAFQALAGLGDDWNEQAIRIAQSKALGALASIGVDVTRTGPTDGALVPTAVLIGLVESAYLHAMAMGAFAALDITDPDLDET